MSDIEQSNDIGKADSQQRSRLLVVDESAENERLSGEIRSNLESLLAREMDGAEKQEKKQASDQNQTDVSAAGHFRVVNVMEEILRMRHLPQIMKELGGCTCSRCQADVLALCLSKLPAKYIVLPDGDRTSPVISYYNKTMNSQIMSVIYQCCEMVRNSPRHSGNGSR